MKIPLPPRVALTHAVIGTLTLSLPANFLLSGSIEILLSDIKVSVTIAPITQPSPPPSPGSRQNPDNSPGVDSEDEESNDELPTTAEDLAQSFLQSQPQREKDQLLHSLYRDRDNMTASTHSAAGTASSSDDDDDDEELGVGTNVGLPKILATLFKGIGDRLRIKIRGVVISLKSTAPEEHGGEKIMLDLEVEDVDVEGVTTNSVTPAGEPGMRHKEGKRRITLDRIKAYITSDASLFEPPSPPAASTIFGEASEVLTEKMASSNMAASRDTLMQAGSFHSMATSTNTIRDQPPQSPPHEEAPPTVEKSLESHVSEDEGVHVDGNSDENNFSGSDRFADFEDSSSDDEVLAFAPSPFAASSRVHTSSGSLPRQPINYDDDEDSEDEGGAAFAPSMFPPTELSSSSSSVRARLPPSFSRTGSPSGSLHARSQSASFYESSPLSSSTHVRSQSGSFYDRSTSTRVHIPSTEAADQPLPSDSPPSLMAKSLIPHKQSPESSSNETEDSESGDEMDAEASRMLSESTLFTHSEAGSLYLSATSGVFNESDRKDEEEGRLKDEADEEEVDADEMDARLDALIGDVAASRAGTSIRTMEEPCGENLKVGRRIRKNIFGLDKIEIFIPSLSVEESRSSGAHHAEAGASNSSGSNETEDNHYPHVPGAFSMYASKRNIASPSKSVSPPRSRRQTMIKIVDKKTPQSTTDHSQEKPDIEISIGKVGGAVDFSTARILGMVIESVTGALSEGSGGLKGKRGSGDTTSNATETAGPNLEIFVEEIALKLVDQLSGLVVRNEEEEGEDELVHNDNSGTVVECLLREIRVAHSNLGQNITTSKIDIKGFFLGDGKGDILSFIQPPSAKSSRKRGSHSSSITFPENDVSFIISQSPTKKRINVTTLPVKLHFDLKRLEDTLGAFGGVGGVLASTSTTASTVTITKGRSPDTLRRWGANETELPEPKKSDVKVHCQIGGLKVEIVGSTGKVGLETSPLKIRSENGSIIVQLDKIGVYGPDLPWDNGRQQVETSLIVENTRVEFLNRPEQEDLAILLALLTPSKDQHVVEDDDIIIDTLIRQRQQGTMLRIGIGGIKATVDDLGVIERLQQVGEDMIKVLTATDFVTQEERPGLLTLLHIDSFHGRIEVGGGIGNLEVDMGDFGVAHVSLPSLFALAVSKIKVRRNGSEELLGEVLQRNMLDKSEEGKSMLMVRVVGDEPDPVVKVKLWNIRLEYRVETLMSLMDTPQKVTTEELVAEMTHSVINLAQKSSRDEDKPPWGVDVVMRDCVLGLNPLGLKSRGLIVLSESRINATLPRRGRLQVAVEVNKAFVMLIDDTSGLNLSDRPDPRRRKTKVNRLVDRLSVQGYVSVISISAADVLLQIVDAERKGEKAIDVEVRDDLLIIESCADSTQTLLGIVNGLKPPMPEGDEIKYRTEIMPLDVFKSMTEDAFAQPSRLKAGSMGPVFSSDDEDDGDLVHDDVPMNLTFVESYYGGHQPTSSVNMRESAHTKDELANSMLDDDLGSIAPGPRKPLGAGDKGMLASFTEQVHVLENGDLAILDDHFHHVQRPTNARKTNLEAVYKWDSSRNEYVPSEHSRVTPYFPLRIKVRDVHVIWNLHDGYDWPGTRDAISQAVKKVESKAAERRNRKVAFDVDDDEGSVIGDILFNSIYIGIPGNKDPKELSKAIFDDQMSETSFAPSSVTDDPSRPTSRSGTSAFVGVKSRNHKLARSKMHKLQIELKGICADVLLFPPDSGETQSSVDLRVKDFEIFDLVPTSTWKKFVTYMQDAGKRETGSNMLHLEIMSVKPVPHLAASEIVLRVCLGLLALFMKITDSFLGHGSASAIACGSRYIGFPDKIL